MTRLSLAVCLLLCAGLGAAAVERRNLLWYVVQSCVWSNRLIGRPDPCLALLRAGERGVGYIVLRSPLDRRHVIVSSTDDIVGVEASELTQPKAAAYFEGAWRSRHYVVDDLQQPLAQTTLGLAVNSRVGRTQDHFHIHVDCLKPLVRIALHQRIADIKTGTWTTVALPGIDFPYQATGLPGQLALSNPVALARSEFKVNARNAEELTLAVVLLSEDKVDPRFALLARLRHTDRRDEGSAENLLDHDCRRTNQRVKL